MFKRTADPSGSVNEDDCDVEFFASPQSYTFQLSQMAVEIPGQHGLEPLAITASTNPRGHAREVYVLSRYDTVQLNVPEMEPLFGVRNESVGVRQLRFA